MPNRCDAKLLQGLVRQARKNRFVYLILAERRLILPEAQAPQPDHDVHSLRPQSVATHIMVWLGGRVQEAEVSDKAVIPGRYGCGSNGARHAGDDMDQGRRTSRLKNLSPAQPPHESNFQSNTNV